MPESGKSTIEVTESNPHSAAVIARADDEAQQHAICADGVPEDSSRLVHLPANSELAKLDGRLHANILAVLGLNSYRGLAG